MSVTLSFQHHRRREAFIAAALREGSMEWTLIIDFVAVIGKRNTILALFIWLMLALAL